MPQASTWEEPARYVLRSGELHAGFEAGDPVRVRPTAPETLHLGDLMAFRFGDRLLAQRFAGWTLREGAVWLRHTQDAEPGYGLVAPGAVVGRVEAMDENGSEGLWSRWCRWFLGLRAAWGSLRMHQPAARSAPLPPELTFLGLAARLELAPPEAARLARLATRKLDWPLVEVQAKRLGMGPLLHRHISASAWAGKVPEATRQCFEAAYLRTALANHRRLGDLRRLLLRLLEEELPVLVLGGAFTAPWVFVDVGLRPLGTLDLLCRPVDRPQVAAVLASHGAGQPAAASASPEAVLEGFIGERTPVAIHFRAFPGSGAESALWDERLEIDWEGLPVGALGWEHQVLYLAVHLACSMGPIHLPTLADLREVLRLQRTHLDWESLGRLARELGIEEACIRAFSLVDERWPGGPARPAGAALEEALGRAVRSYPHQTF